MQVGFLPLSDPLEQPQAAAASSVRAPPAPGLGLGVGHRSLLAPVGVGGGGARSGQEAGSHGGTLAHSPMVGNGRGPVHGPPGCKVHEAVHDGPRQDQASSKEPKGVNGRRTAHHSESSYRSEALPANRPP